MLDTLYWAGKMPTWYFFALNCSTLVGAMFGQVFLGVLGDVLGRKKVYGFELLIVIMASLGFASAASGVNDSMSIIGWLTFWRFIMGCGIGSDVRIFRSPRICSDPEDETPDKFLQTEALQGSHTPPNALSQYCCDLFEEIR